MEHYNNNAKTFKRSHHTIATESVTTKSNSKMVCIQQQDVVCIGNHHLFIALHPGNRAFFHVLQSEYDHFQYLRFTTHFQIRHFYEFVVDLLTEQGTRFIMMNHTATSWMVMSRDDALRLVASAYEGFGPEVKEKSGPLTASESSSAPLKFTENPKRNKWPSVAKEAIQQNSGATTPLFPIHRPRENVCAIFSPRNESDQQTILGAMQESTSLSQLLDDFIGQDELSKMLDSSTLVPQGVLEEVEDGNGIVVEDQHMNSLLADVVDYCAMTE